MDSGGDAGSGWDFFVSYTQADRAWAEWVAWTLEEDGYRVLVQAWDMVPGSNWIARMQDGVRKADRTVAVLSEDYLGSVFGGAEWQAAWAQDPAGTDRRLLPVRVKPCDWDKLGLVTGVVGIDLVGLDEAAAAGRLRSKVSAAVTGRAKPSAAPGFPGPGGRRAVLRARFPGGMPRVWKVPARNPNFTGRGGEIAGVAAGLTAGPRITVHGLGGVGKTALAAEYAYAHAGDYDLVWWVTADEPALIADQFVALAAGLGLEPDPDPDAVRAQVHEALREAGDWLLVFDNADTVDGIRRWLPGGPRPAGTRGHVIITTRRGGFASVGPVLDLDVIGTRDAVALLRTRVPGLDQATGELIAEELECLPLALEQAAAYLDQTQIPPAEYLELLQVRAAEVYARGRAGDRPDTIATLWDLSLEKSHSRTRLRCSCLISAPTWLPGRSRWTCSPATPKCCPSRWRRRPVTRWPSPTRSRSSWITPWPSGPRPGCSCTVWSRPPSAPATPARPPRRPGDPMATDETAQAAPLAVALGLLAADAPVTIMDAPQDWPRWAVLLPHVLAATSQAAGPAGQDAAADTSWLLDRAATYLQVHARLADARPLAERAVAIDEAALGPDHPGVAVRLSNLALILRDLGLAAEARPLAERALAISEAALGPDHPTVATSLSILVAIFQDLGLAEDARRLQDRARSAGRAESGAAGDGGV